MRTALDTSEIANAPVCRRLRTKMYYVVGREHVNLRVSAPAGRASSRLKPARRSATRGIHAPVS